MFDGEMASLESILKTETVKVPKPVKVIELDTGGCIFAMEHVDMKGLNKYGLFQFVHCVSSSVKYYL